jgi:hypothetical protein
MRIATIEKACPLCGGDVKGNQEHKFFCKRCNLLFEQEMLKRQPDFVRPAALAVPSARAKTTSLKYIGSTQSQRYHMPGCRYVRQINRENLVHFDSGLQAESKGYRKCICVRGRK